MREAIYRHLCVQLSNGVPIDVALALLKKRFVRRKRQDAAQKIELIGQRMHDGLSLADAVKPWIRFDEYAVLSAGELAGELPRVFTLIIKAQQRKYRILSAFKNALMTPFIYASLMGGMLWAIGHFVTPSVESSLPENKALGMVYALYVIGDFANSLWALLPILVMGIFMLMVWYSFPYWVGKYRIYAEHFFPYALYRDLQGFLWLMSFTQLLGAGLPDTVILERQHRHAAPWMKERLQAYGFRMKNGASLSGALLARGMGGMPAFGFPHPDMVDDIESMAGFSDFPQKMTVLAMQWADDLEQKTLALAKSIGLAMEVTMYVLMGLLMVAINQLSSQLSMLHG